MSRCCEDINCESMSSCLKGTFPIFSWLRTYKREDFMSDVISGCTVAVMHIPQGMGYALLANLPPVTGIYMAFFPVLLYVIFGTSRHNSMGKWLLGVEEITWRILHTSIKTHLPSFPTSSFSSFFCVCYSTGTFAVISLMVGKTVTSYSYEYSDSLMAQQAGYSAIEVATLVCFIVGVIQVINNKLLMRKGWSLFKKNSAIFLSSH